MSINKIVNKYLFGIALGGALSGCETDKSMPVKTEHGLEENEVQYSFAEFTKYRLETNVLHRFSGVATADVDGNGDQDIIAINEGGCMYIIENKMPQKK